MSYWAILEPHCEAVDIHSGSARFLETFNALPTIARTLYAAHWCESEISSGGFDQFFCNATGVLGPEAAMAFRDLGLPDVAAILEEAMATLGDPYPREHTKRQALVAALADYYPNRLAELGQRFWQACDSSGSHAHEAGRLHAAMDRYVNQP